MLAKEKITVYCQLMRLHKPIGIFLLLWPTLWALWLAAHSLPDTKILIIFIVGTVIMRSAGCVINDIADRHFDGHVKRTRERPLVTGRVTLKEAISLFLLLCCSAFILILFLNSFTQLLAIGGLCLAILYPFTKRFTYWPQLVLGAAFGWAVPMAFAAQTNTLSTTAWALFMIAILWPLAYDTIYAMVDREDDRLIGIKSTALLFESYDRLFIGIIQVIIIVLLWLIGQWQQLGYSYYVGLALGTLHFIYQQYLIKDRIPERCFKAFLSNNWFGLIIFIGLIISVC